MNGAEALAKTLSDHDIQRAWCFAGGTVSLLLHELNKVGVQVIVMRNEAAAGHAAQAAWRVTGKPQVVLVTSGPGVTNVVTPVADAWFDGDAVIFFTGQVAQKDMRGELPVRQRGFQETDTLAIMGSITRFALLAKTADHLAFIAGLALAESVARRPAPIVVDVPMDVQRETYAGTVYEAAEKETEAPLNVSAALVAIQKAEKPLIVAGRGALSSYQAVRELVQERNINLVASLPAVGILPTDWPQYKGMLGHTGHERANRAVHEADCICALGARLDIRQTGSMVKEWAEGKTIIRVDIDAGELANSRIRVDYPFHCSVGGWLSAIQRITKD